MSNRETKLSRLPWVPPVATDWLEDQAFWHARGPSSLAEVDSSHRLPPWGIHRSGRAVVAEVAADAWHPDGEVEA
jgi:hypothetical protein